MGEQLRRYESYARGVKRLLLLAGLWPGRVSSRFFRLVVVIHFTTSIITACGIMHFVVSNRTNIGLLTKGLGIAVSFYTILLKVIVFSIYRDRLAELHETLEKNFRADLANSHYRAALLSPIEYFYRPTIWLSLSTLGVISMYNLNPLISIIIQLSHGAEVLQHRTPFPSKYPFPEGNSLFVVTYVVEVAASYAIGSITASTDALFGFYVFQMSSQLRVLSYRMCNLTASDDHLSVIRECVTRRQTLTRCRDHLQTIYGPILVWMLTTSAMTMCANIFQASQISIDKAVLVFVYIVMKLMQCLLYGWFGLFLTTEVRIGTSTALTLAAYPPVVTFVYTMRQSEGLRDATYCSGWPGCGDKLFLSNVLTMLMCKPLVLKACQFYTISIDMFMAIMNTTLSYFFLLRTLDEK